MFGPEIILPKFKFLNSRWRRKDAILKTSDEKFKIQVQNLDRNRSGILKTKTIASHTLRASGSE